MKTLFSILMVMSFLFSTAMANEFKVAVVDMQKALQEVEVGKKAKSTLEKEFNEKKKKLEQEEASIKKMTEEFQKKIAVLSDDAKMKKQAELQERMLKYREFFGKSQMDIQTRERELTEPIVKKLRTVVEKMGNEKGYQLILEKNENNVLYLKSKDDLTEDVIKQFNKSA